jgi:hypothetical protein
MSGTGKSSALAELAKRGFGVVDTHHGGWSLWSNAAGGYVWDERRIEALLTREEGSTLYVSGTVSNQERFFLSALRCCRSPECSCGGSAQPDHYEGDQRLRQES